MIDTDAIHSALSQLRQCSAVRVSDLEALPGTGIAHDHVRVRGLVLDGAPALLRIPRLSQPRLSQPRLSQWGLDAKANLAYQRACFMRAEPSAVTPRLLAVIPVCPSLPTGALVVEEILGSKPSLPGDMTALANALAAIHMLPAPATHAPLVVHGDAVAATLKVIEAQASFFEQCDIAGEARAAIADEMAWARKFKDRDFSAQDFAGQPAPLSHPRCLVATDTHPGNFLIEAAGARRTVLVDLEKMLYGSPAIDLAHASLATSTLWDADCAAILGPREIAGFIAAYFAAVGAEAAAALKPWIVPMRRLTWLRTMSWCARWLVLSRSGEDWSTGHLDPAFARHLEATIPGYFDPARIAGARREWLDPSYLQALI